VTDAEHLIRSAREAQPAWAARPAEERVALLGKARASLDPEALAETLDAHPFEALAMEVASFLESMRWLQKEAPDLLGERTVTARVAPHKRMHILRRPRGVTLSLAPYNFPLAIGGGDAAFALAAGNAVVVKAPPGCAAALRMVRDALIDAGLDERLMLVIDGDAALGQALLDAGPDYVIFTGSEENGRTVAAACAARLTPCTLELGGNAAAIVLEDADLDRAARAVVWGALVRGGQVCAAVERVYCVARVYPALAEKVRAELEALDEADLTRPPDLREDAAPDDPLVLEEQFTSLLPLVSVEEEARAVELANETGHGLIASVFTRDRARFERVAAALKTGTVMRDDVVFAYGIPAGPWAARGRSGWGSARGEEGLLAHTAPQFVVDTRTPPLPREAWWFPYTDRRRQWIARGLRAVYGNGALRALRALLPHRTPEKNDDPA
jgi:acyl-CoA reductase-like NAD-dependent aldehyde dehydrogenase